MTYGTHGNLSLITRSSVIRARCCQGCASPAQKTAPPLTAPGRMTPTLVINESFQVAQSCRSGERKGVELSNWRLTRDDLIEAGGTRAFFSAYPREQQSTENRTLKRVRGRLAPRWGAETLLVSNNRRLRSLTLA